MVYCSDVRPQRFKRALYHMYASNKIYTNSAMPRRSQLRSRWLSWLGTKVGLRQPDDLLPQVHQRLLHHQGHHLTLESVILTVAQYSVVTHRRKIIINKHPLTGVELSVVDVHLVI